MGPFYLPQAVCAQVGDSFSCLAVLIPSLHVYMYWKLTVKITSVIPGGVTSTKYLHHFPFYSEMSSSIFLLHSFAFSASVIWVFSLLTSVFCFHSETGGAPSNSIHFGRKNLFQTRLEPNGGPSGIWHFLESTVCTCLGCCCFSTHSLKIFFLLNYYLHPNY